MNVVIRPIQESDITEFHRVLDGVCRERRYLAALEGPSLERIERFVKNNVLMDHPQYVALVDGQIVGWCDALPGDAGSGMAHVGHLGMGVVRPFRRAGIGEKLIRAVLEKAREKDFLKVELGVYASNVGAIALYEKMGFTQEGRNVRARLVDDQYDDVILMALFLET